MVSLDGKEVPSIHYTVHDEEEPSGLKEDVDLYEPTLMEDKDTSGICKYSLKHFSNITQIMNIRYGVIA